MKKIFLFSILFFNNFTFSEKLNSKDYEDLYLDSTWMSESKVFEKISMEAINIIAYQNSQQDKIINTVLNFFEEENFSNTDLWTELDKITENFSIYSDELNTIVNGLNIKSESKNSKAQKLYSNALNILHELNDFSLSNNQLNIEIINHLSEGDLEKYEFKVAKSYFKSADFLQLVADYQKTSSAIMPSNSIVKTMLLLDSSINEYVSVATRVNAYQMSGNLDLSILNKYKTELRKKYSVIDSGKTYRDLISKLERLDDLKNDLNKTKDYDNLIRAINNIISSSKLYTEASLRNVEIWKDIIDFYYSNSAFLDDLYSDSIRSATFDNLLERQRFAMEQISKFSNEYSQASIEFQSIFPDILAQSIDR